MEAGENSESESSDNRHRLCTAVHAAKISCVPALPHHLSEVSARSLSFLMPQTIGCVDL